MTTVLDLYALRQMQPLEAAEHLTGLSLAELKAITQLLNLKPKRADGKPELVGLILAVTHPAAPSAAIAVGGAVQERLF